MIKILVANNDLSKRRFILYQVNSTDENINDYVWDSRTLDDSGSWMLEFPLNIKTASKVEQERGQWELTCDTPQAPRGIVKGSKDPIGHEIDITYVSGAGRVNALLLKSREVALSKDLTLDSLVGFKLNNSFFIAISDNMKRGDIIVINELIATYEIDTRNNQLVDMYEVTATSNNTSSENTTDLNKRYIEPANV